MPTLPPETALVLDDHCWPVSSDILAQTGETAWSVAAAGGDGLNVAHRLAGVGPLGRDDGRSASAPNRTAHWPQHEARPTTLFALFT